ncbi:MAG: hypothetical protein QM479_05450 [Pseudomonadota bacterium]
MKGYYLDPHPHANVAAEHYAVVNIPRRKGQKKQRTIRDRCPETQVNLVADKETAVERAKQGDSLFAAKVMGPARSSEGCNIYYLLDVFDIS